ncbi:regulator [Halorientalis sp. IM1011]|uniref:YlbF family regulator n=1 Tax=Halorientalis sp. IM1011 TaxID=1932360 RepID=UPI00097CCCB1|nr:YlbF family regulator [Halorientalis sp. IM1011]AQL41371.1 regulator [Halorientalis sp. IM1011]
MSIDTESGETPQSTVDQLSRDLGEAIADLPAYQRFEEAKEAVENDEEAQEKIQEFEEFREEFMLARQTGEATQDDLRELQAKQEALHDIPVMAEFLQAQNELELHLQEINETISEPLRIDFGQKAGGCCED